MTEQDWLACDDPTLMFEFLRGETSDRKLRLLAVGCVRSVLHLLPQPHFRAAVGVAEEFADGRATLAALRTIHAAFDIELEGAW